MKLLTEDAGLYCKHRTGRVVIEPTQELVYIEKRQILLEPNPEGRPVKGCSNLGPGIVPCNLTLKVRAGYSTLLFIDGKPICLDTVVGLTNGTPGTIDYVVREPGQELVTENA